MKKVFGIIIILFLISNILFEENVLATSDDWNQGIKNMKKAEATGEYITNTENTFATIIKVARTVALGIAVIMLLVLSIKYMTASAEGKATFWKSAMIYVTGALIFFGTSGILTILADFAEKELKNGVV